jgi:hypothetical protein
LLSDSIGTLDLKGIEGWNTGIEQMNAMASLYASGTKAISARSVNAEDINKVTGYTPYKTGDGTACRRQSGHDIPYI